MMMPARRRLYRVITVKGPQAGRYSWGRRLCYGGLLCQLGLALPLLLGAFLSALPWLEVTAVSLLLLTFTATILGCCLYKNADAYVEERLECHQDPYIQSNNVTLQDSQDLQITQQTSYDRTTSQDTAGNYI